MCKCIIKMSICELPCVLLRCFITIVNRRIWWRDKTKTHLDQLSFIGLIQMVLWNISYMINPLYDSWNGYDINGDEDDEPTLPAWDWYMVLRMTHVHYVYKIDTWCWGWRIYITCMKLKHGVEYDASTSRVWNWYMVLMMAHLHYIYETDACCWV